ncbi:MAG: DUF5711 family protein [Lachnospiraceae bacterium]|nr:DUF5711 family protein [Lachnospiraceae bacterium]
MADKTQFRTIETDPEEYEGRLRAHRRRMMKVFLIFAGVVLAAVGVILLVVNLHTYSSYVVEDYVEREDSASCQYIAFGRGFIKYSNDGAIYTDASNTLYWNQSFEMQNPMVAVCEDYVAFADQGGTKVYILNENGVQGQVDTAMSISKIRVANQGTIAVLMNDKGTYYLRMYDKEGNNLAKGALHVANSGYPLDIALCNDGKKLAVSMLDITDAKVSTSIRFYNFGSVGQNEIDNLVGEYDYDNAVIPDIQFADNDTMYAFGDDRIVIFEGTQKPEPTEEITLEQQVRSVFYNEKYIGIVYNNEEDAEESRHMETYDRNGKRVVNKDFSMDYHSVEFLEDGEICIHNDTECMIFSAYGIKRFEYTFDQPVHKVLSGATKTHYIFVLEGRTEKVRLK